MTEQDHDYSKFELSSEEKSSNSMAALADLAREQLNCEASVEACEARLKEAKEALNDVYMKRLPELMDELDLADFSTSNGLKIQVREKMQQKHIKGQEICKKNNTKNMKLLQSIVNHLKKSQGSMINGNFWNLN